MFVTRACVQSSRQGARLPTWLWHSSAGPMILHTDLLRFRCGLQAAWITTLLLLLNSFPAAVGQPVQDCGRLVHFRVQKVRLRYDYMFTVSTSVLYLLLGRVGHFASAADTGIVVLLLLCCSCCAALDGTSLSSA